MPDRPLARATGASIVDRVALDPVGRRRIENTLAFLMSVFGVLFGLEILPSLLGEWPHMASTVGAVIVVLVYGTIGIAGLASMARQWTRWSFWAAGVAYIVAILLWPLAIVQPLDDAGMPWLVANAGIACGFVIIGSRSWATPMVYAVVVSVILVLVRTTPAGGGRPLEEAAVEVAYNFLLALALLAIVLAVRMAARQVDRAQTAALGRYAAAQIDEATEAERTRTDALVHDSVLTTFLSAAQSGSPEGQALAARMARHTMDVLARATVASHVGPKVPVHDLLDRIRTDAAGLGDAFEYAVRDVRDHFLPENVADAVASAAVQAMTNSVKHAGGPEIARSVVIQGTGGGGVQVVVSDRGKGFDPAMVASERLGLRVSILERMRRVGGEVRITTAPGEGATFVLSWPAAAQVADPVRDDAVMTA